ncbi:hypothetical protein Glove_368g30 [Diversispora epigaea]|uniref:Uncharacterized protein n=1 Tax=Diversispora epigaea TaxID=1348612 RepID=A0A397HB41_9GLOM|nr:hypothetical protein Glove_368g30 [Diversispora epigaea]
MPKKLFLSDAIKIAESHGGKCLSKEYFNNGTQEMYKRTLMVADSWCPHCHREFIRLGIVCTKELAQ